MLKPTLYSLSATNFSTSVNSQTKTFLDTLYQRLLTLSKYSRVEKTVSFMGKPKILLNVWQSLRTSSIRHFCSGIFDKVAPVFFAGSTKKTETESKNNSPYWFYFAVGIVCFAEWWWILKAENCKLKISRDKQKKTKFCD